MNLSYLYDLSILWCPKVARWLHLIDDHQDAGGPAHELGHALIEPRERWRRRDYGRCSLSSCVCRDELCRVYEAAAMRISSALLRAAGRPELVGAEIESTSDYDLIEPSHFAHARVLLKKKGLWPVPRTKRSLESALARRLGRPRGSARRPPPRRVQGSVAMAMLVDQIYSRETI